MAVLSTFALPARLALAAIHLPPWPNSERTREIFRVIDELDGGQQLDRLAALDFNKLASAIHTPIPIFGARHRAFLICTDHDTVGLLLQTPSDDPSDRGETVRFAVSKFHQLYKAMPVGFQNILDGFLVAQGLLPPFEAKYL